MMVLLLESLTVEQLMEVASQAEKRQPITDPAIQELLKGVARIGSTMSGSDEWKSYMLAQLKSSIIHFRCPIIYLTINPHERYYDNKLSRLIYIAHDKKIKLRGNLAPGERFLVHVLVSHVG